MFHRSISNKKHSGFDTLIILVDFVQAEGVSDGQSQTRNK